MDSQRNQDGYHPRTIVRFALSCALSHACRDERRGVLLSSEAERASLGRQLASKWIALQGREAEQETIRYVQVLFSYLYGKTCDLLAVQQPELSGLADLIAQTSEEDGDSFVTEFARRSLESGVFEQWYHIPSGRDDSNEVLQLTASIALHTVCLNYPDALVHDRERIEQTAFQKICASPLYHPVFEPFLAVRQEGERSFAVFYSSMVELFDQHPAIGEHLRSVVLAAVQPEEGVIKALEWLSEHITEYQSRAASMVGLGLRLLLSEPELLPTSLEGLLREGNCAYSGCSNPCSPVADIRLPFRNRQWSTTAYACKEHRQVILDHCTGPELLQFARHLVREQGEPLVGPPLVAKYRDPALGRPDPKKIQHLLERFRVRQRLDPDGPTAQMLRRKGERALLFGEAFTDAYVDLAKKYLLAPSALAVITYLPFETMRQAMETAKSFGDYVWMELEEPIQTPRGTLYGFSFGVKGEEAIQYAQSRYPLRQGPLNQVRSILLEPPGVYHCGLDACNEYGEALWTISYQQQIVGGQRRETWIIPTWSRACSDPTCGGEKICPACSEVAEFYLGLYANAVMLISGEFSERENMREFPTKQVRVVRKDRDAVKMHRFQSREVEHTISLITFNALKRAAQRSGGHSGTRGSWLAKVEPGTVVWLKYRFEKPKRKLRHDRYRSYILRNGGDPDDEEGFEIPVQPFTRRTPMKLETLRRRMVRVIFQRKVDERKAAE